jgi:GNAT superfamily N-acetyltransferase
MATFVAEVENGFAGIADGFLKEGEGVVEIGGMWVAPSLRRSGVGRALLAALCEWARSRGAKRAALWVRGSNDAARYLYQREGFELATTSDVAGETGLRLERQL